MFVAQGQLRIIRCKMMTFSSLFNFMQPYLSSFLPPSRSFLRVAQVVCLRWRLPLRTALCGTHGESGRAGASGDAAAQRWRQGDQEGADPAGRLGVAIRGGRTLCGAARSRDGQGCCPLPAGGQRLSAHRPRESRAAQPVLPADVQGETCAGFEPFVIFTSRPAFSFRALLVLGD